MAYSGIFPKKIEIPDDSFYCDEPLAEGIPVGSLCPSFVKIMGTKYEPGMVVVLKSISFGNLEVGVIKNIFFFNGKVLFRCETFKAVLGKSGIYCSTERTNQATCESTKLADHQPLRSLGPTNNFRFVLHHFISETCII